jgi:hypothetical protein
MLTEIDAAVPDGGPEEVQRIALENGAALRLVSQSCARG